RTRAGRCRRTPRCTRSSAVSTRRCAPLALDGEKPYREVFDLIYRRQASGPNEVWQADHTEPDPGWAAADSVAAELRPGTGLRVTVGATGAAKSGSRATGQQQLYQV